MIGITKEQAELVRRSFQQLAPAAGRAAESFYSRLFAARPELRELFRGDLDLQRQKFIHTLEILVGLLDKPELLLPEAADLGHRHIAYGVLNSHYGVVGESLIGALKQELSGYFGADVEAAWVALYRLVGSAMRGEEIPPLPVSE